jgi:cyclopentanol dehydrogenase
MGAAICRLLADAGAQVVIADIQVDKAETLAAAIRERGGAPYPAGST